MNEYCCSLLNILFCNILSGCHVVAAVLFWFYVVLFPSSGLSSFCCHILSRPSFVGNLALIYFCNPHIVWKSFSCSWYITQPEYILISKFRWPFHVFLSRLLCSWVHFSCLLMSHALSSILIEITWFLIWIRAGISHLFLKSIICTIERHDWRLISSDCLFSVSFNFCSGTFRFSCNISFLLPLSLALVCSASHAFSGSGALPSLSSVSISMVNFPLVFSGSP